MDTGPDFDDPSAGEGESVFMVSPIQTFCLFSYVPNLYFFIVSEFSDQSLKLLLHRAAWLLLNVSVQT